eukprot:COSAG05_NODE_2529_length_2942_cov_4.653887_2_plen_820_part_01
MANMQNQLVFMFGSDPPSYGPWQITESMAAWSAEMEELMPSLYAPFGQRDSVTAIVTNASQDQGPPLARLANLRARAWQENSNCVHVVVVNSNSSATARPTISLRGAITGLQGQHATRLFDACYEVPLMQSTDSGKIHYHFVDYVGPESTNVYRLGTNCTDTTVWKRLQTHMYTSRSPHQLLLPSVSSRGDGSVMTRRPAKLDDEVRAASALESVRRQLECSYNGEQVSGICICAKPWLGERCNQLPPPASGRPRDVAHYTALFSGTGTFVAVCDPTDAQQRDDCTAGLAQALNRSGTVVVPRLEDLRRPGRFVPWPTRGMRFLSDNTVVIFEHGVEIQALKNSSYLFACHLSAHFIGFGGGDLASAENRKNLSVVGYGAVWRSWRDNYIHDGCTHSQFRMGFRVNNCSDMEVAGLTIRESGGDGVIVMSMQCRSLKSCQNIGASKRLLIRDVILDRNYRQGLSVISAQDMRIINTTFSNTNGTGPSGGVDLEPDSSDLANDPQRITNVSFHNCVAINNSGSGFQGYFLNMMHICNNGTCPNPWEESSPYPLTISFENCSVIGGNGGWTFGSIMPNLRGQIEIKGGTVSGNKGPGVHVMSKALNAVPIRFIGHTVRNVARGGISQCALSPFPYIYPRCCKTNQCLPGLLNTPINLIARHGLTPQIEGAITFEDCTIEDDLERPWFQMLGDAEPQQPPVPYPASKGQGTWSGVYLTNLHVTTFAKRLCEPNVSHGRLLSTNVSCVAHSTALKDDDKNNARSPRRMGEAIITTARRKTDDESQKGLYPAALPQRVVNDSWAAARGFSYQPYFPSVGGTGVEI